MGKIKENPKAVESRARKEGAKKASQSAAAQAAEDSDWAAAGEGAKSKAQAKKDAQAKEREQAAAKKAEAKKLAAQEEAELAASAKKANKKAAAPATKVTAFERQKQQEADQRQQVAEAAKAAKDKQRMVDEESYEAQVAVENPNRAPVAADARTVEEALSVLGVQEEEDKHPEKRMKAAFAKYKEEQLPILRQDKPGLKLTQYQDMIFKNWQKSPQNPLVRAQLAGK